MACQYVGIDLHRRRWVIVWQTPDGEVVDTVRIDNDPGRAVLRGRRGRTGSRGRHRGYLRVVLGGRRARGVRSHGASGVSARREGVRLPAREERRA
jgi:hypothetical protein